MNLESSGIDDESGARGMTSPSTPPTSIELGERRTELADDRTKLALLRTVIALDRTLMAWVRTATSLISFGFTIYKFFQALRANQPPDQTHLMTPRDVGMIMIGLGVGSLLVATIEYRRQMKQLQAEFPQFGPIRHSPAPAVAAVICGLGILGFVMVFLHQ